MVRTDVTVNECQSCMLETFIHTIKFTELYFLLLSGVHLQPVLYFRFYSPLQHQMEHPKRKLYVQVCTKSSSVCISHFVVRIVSHLIQKRFN